MPGLSERAYARHRGVTHRAVQKAIRAGRITPNADGTIDPGRADAEWNANTDPAAKRSVENENGGGRPETASRPTPALNIRRILKKTAPKCACPHPLVAISPAARSGRPIAPVVRSLPSSARARVCPTGAHHRRPTRAPPAVAPQRRAGRNRVPESPCRRLPVDPCPWGEDASGCVNRHGDPGQSSTLRASGLMAFVVAPMAPSQEGRGPRGRMTPSSDLRQARASRRNVPVLHKWGISDPM